jgi:LysM repeat protein
VNQDKDEAAQEFMKEVADDLGYTPRGEREQRSKRADLRSGPGFLIPGGIGILLLIAVTLFFFTGRSEVSEKDLRSIQAGLNSLEAKLVRLDGLEERIAHLEKEEKKLRQSVNEIAERNLNNQKKRSSPQVKRRYHTVHSGESLYTIANKYGISTDKLCRLNKITPKKPIKPGQKLLVGQ